MGREARRKADNRGDRLRGFWAKSACLKLLEQDLRIQEAFREWVQDMDRLAVAGVPPSVESQADLERAIADHQARQIEAVAVVLRGMEVPFGWCPHVLAGISFPAMRANARRTAPDDLMHGYKAEIDLRGVPRGQAPPHDGQGIEDGVTWWYRARIKQPLDSIHVLAAEYAERQNRVTDCRSVVQNGIKQAETLLVGDFEGWRTDTPTTK